VSCALRRDSSRVARASGKERSSFWHLRVAQECRAWHAGLSGLSNEGFGWLRVAHIQVARCADSSVHPVRCHFQIQGWSILGAIRD
ncbi:hypothetical protein A2U01_0069642, partial [Trifolium medium]|nr:hypothetical protein [Trifolium medium]